MGQARGTLEVSGGVLGWFRRTLGRPLGGSVASLGVAVSTTNCFFMYTNEMRMFLGAEWGLRVLLTHIKTLVVMGPGPPLGYKLNLIAQRTIGRSETVPSPRGSNTPLGQARRIYICILCQALLRQGSV